MLMISVGVSPFRESGSGNVFFVFTDRRMSARWRVRNRTPPVRRCPRGTRHGWAVWPPAQVARSGSRSATEGRRSWGRRVATVERMLRPESCVRPAGVSPVPVRTGAPGSRPRFVGEILRADRGVKSTAAPSSGQWESRAAHVTAKAMCRGPCSGLSLRGLFGVWVAARAQGLAGNRRDPSAHAWRRAETGRISRW